MPSFAQVTKAEKGLIWLLVHRHGEALAALAELEAADLAHLAARPVLDLARKLNEDRGFSPAVFLERLSMVEAQLVTAVASETEPHVHDAETCVRIVRRMRYERERSALQQEIDRLQGRAGEQDADRLTELLVRKYDVIQRIDALA
jgi:hypothetical protein